MTAEKLAGRGGGGQARKKKGKSLFEVSHEYKIYFIHFKIKPDLDYFISEFRSFLFTKF